MTETSISEIKLEKTKEAFSSDDNITINVRFSIKGGLRESFTEKNWTEAYEKNDNITMNKLKPYLDEIISQIKNFYGYTSILLTRVIITELPKGSIIPEHADEGELLNTNHRVHIPLVSDPTVKFSLDHKDYYLKPGYAYEINNQLIHAVRNESNIDRIHMIIDLKEWKNNDKEIKAYEVDLKNY